MCCRTRWCASWISEYEREKRWLGLETIPAIGIYRAKEHLFAIMSKWGRFSMTHFGLQSESLRNVPNHSFVTIA